MRARSIPLVMLAALFAPHCTCAPSKAGDPCDLEAAHDACPTGHVCEETDDGGRCFIAVGGSCDAEADDPFCAAGAACAGPTPSCGGAGAACDLRDDNCAAPLGCDPRASDDEAGLCATPVVVRGTVSDAKTRDPLGDADVLVLDQNGVPLARVAHTDDDGRFAVRVPAPRGDDGSVADGVVTLHVAARDHQAFPGGVRPALLLHLADAAPSDDESELTLKSASTSIALMPLPAIEQGRPTVAGTVAAGGERAGVLVVVEGAQVPAPTALTDLDGVFRVFNAPRGAAIARGYAAGLELDAAPLVIGDDDVARVVLVSVDPSRTTVSGDVQFVGAAAEATTSVALVPASTFVATAERGSTPRGLRTSTSGAFSIEGVPRGSYVMLASMDDDVLVRDPNPAIAGAQIVALEVTGADQLVIDDAIRVMPALLLLSPGADGPELIDAPPVFVFENAAPDHAYRVEVLDSFGALVWSTEAAAPSGDDVEVPFTGAELDAGAFYQVRVTALVGGVAAQRTDEQRGVFVVAE